MKYKAVLFDIDGTLLNTRDGVLSAVRKTLTDKGFRDIRKDEEHLFIGPPIQKSMMSVFGITKDEAQEFANDFRVTYRSHEYLFRAEPYDGIIKLLGDIKEAGLKIAVATYKREDYAIEIMEHFKVTDYAQVVHGADNFNKLTKADIIRKCIADLGIDDPSEVIMVGDSDNDAIGAEGIGCPFIGVTYGFGFTCDEDVTQYNNIGAAASAGEIMDIIKAQLFELA